MFPIVTRLRRFAVALAGFCLIASVTQAAPVTWTLNNVNFDDGGNAIGSFIYDADTNAFSNISIITSAGSTLPGATFTIDTGLSSATRLDLFSSSPATPNNDWRFLLSQFAAMTNAGGTLAIPTANSLEATCLLAGCGGGGGVGAPQRRVLAGGTLVGTVPEPASLSLLAGALVIGGWISRRRRAA